MLFSLARRRPTTQEVADRASAKAGTVRDVEPIDAAGCHNGRALESARLRYLNSTLCRLSPTRAAPGCRQRRTLLAVQDLTLPGGASILAGMTKPRRTQPSAVTLPPRRPPPGQGRHHQPSAEAPRAAGRGPHEVERTCRP